QRYLPWHGAELQRVDHVARKRGPAANDLVAGIERELRQVIDDPVRARAGRDLLETDVMSLGERRSQAVGAAVGVAVQLLGAPRERLERGRERPERALVRRQLDDTLEPELALHLLDRLAGLVGNDVANGRLEERIRDLCERHGPTLVEVDCHQDRVYVLTRDPVVAAAKALLEEAGLLVKGDRRLVVREGLQLDLRDAGPPGPTHALLHQRRADTPATLGRRDHQPELSNVVAERIVVARDR